MLRAVYFDLDGTLGETLPICVEAFKLALEPILDRRLSDEEIYAHFGVSDEGVIRALAPENFQEGIAGYLRHYGELHDRKCPRAFEGIGEALEFLKEKGVLLAMVTGKGIDSARISMEKFGLGHYFPDIVAGSPDSPGKGHGMIGLLRRHGLSPTEAAYVGDVPGDITAAREAGVMMLSAAWAGTADYDALVRMRPDHVFRTVGEFAAYLRGIFP